MAKPVMFLMALMAWASVVSAGELTYQNGDFKRVVKVSKGRLEKGRDFLISHPHQREFAVRTLIINNMAAMQELPEDVFQLGQSLDFGTDFLANVLLPIIHNEEIRTTAANLLLTTYGLLTAQRMMEEYNKIYPHRVAGGSDAFADDRPNPQAYLNPKDPMFLGFVDVESAPLYRQLIQQLDAKETSLNPGRKPIHRCEYCLKITERLCEPCGKKHFCSKSCEFAGFRTHKIECVPPKKPGDKTRAAL